MTTWRAGITERVYAPGLGTDIGIICAIALLTLVVVARGVRLGRSGSQGSRVLTWAAAVVSVAGLVAFFPVALADRRHGGVWNHIILIAVGAVVVGGVAAAHEAPRAYGPRSSAAPYLVVDLATTFFVAFGVFWIVGVALAHSNLASRAQLDGGLWVFVASLVLGAMASALRAVQRKRSLA